MASRSLAMHGGHFRGLRADVARRNSRGIGYIMELASGQTYAQRDPCQNLSRGLLLQVACCTRRDVVAKVSLAMGSLPPWAMGIPCCEAWLCCRKCEHQGCAQLWASLGGRGVVTCRIAKPAPHAWLLKRCLEVMEGCWVPCISSASHWGLLWRGPASAPTTLS